MTNLRTFKVTRALSATEIQQIAAQRAVALYPIREGHMGYIPDMPFNFYSPGKLKPYIWVQLLRYGPNGLAFVTDAGPDGRCIVPTSHIQIGAWYTPEKEKVVIDTNIWVQTTIRGGDGQPLVYQFRTHPKRVQTDRQITIFSGKESKAISTAPCAFKLQLTQDLFPSIRPSSIVNVVIEIMADPTASHTFSYLEITSVGPFDCWTQAMRVAIRIEFLDDDGQWKTRYLRNDQYIPFTSGINDLNSVEYDEHCEYIDCLEVNWVQCMKMLATLLGWKWQPQSNMLAEGVFAPYNERVRNCDFDFLKQQYILSDSEPIDKMLPRLRTLDETTDLIKYQSGYDTHIGYFPGKEWVWVKGNKLDRTSCDLCHIGSQDANQGDAGHFKIAAKCEHNVIDTKHGKNLVQCQFSAALRRYCTFTPGIETKQYQERYYKLTYHMLQPFKQLNIPKPSNTIQFREQSKDGNAGPAEDDSMNVDAD